MNIFFYKKKCLELSITEENDAIVNVSFGRRKPKNVTLAETPLIKEAAAQIDDYLAGRRRQFSLPLALHGTEFQLAVWKALQTIPYGETRSYCDIAAQIGKPKAARAVGMANHNNPVSIIIPCHRVIGKNGGLTGYGGGLHIKKFLLDLEQKALGGK
jgi:methylated-DNA-[protein]-cysteine S-methyltransferase